MHTGISRTRTMTVAALALLLQGCGGPKSSSTGSVDGGPVPTNRMTLYMTVEATEPNQAVVRVNLSDGKVFGESFRLDGGDYLRACFNGTCRTMADNDSVFNPDYIARFSFQSGVDYYVEFNRRETSGAPQSYVRLPPAFTIVTPANRQQVTDGDNVMVEWSPTGAPARASLRYEAQCHYVGGTESSSTGTLSADTNADGREPVSVNEIVSFAQLGKPTPITRCNIDVIVSHELQGRADPAFRSGTVRGLTSRTVSLDYAALT